MPLLNVCWTNILMTKGCALCSTSSSSGEEAAAAGECFSNKDNNAEQRITWYSTCKRHRDAIIKKKSIFYFIHKVQMWHQIDHIKLSLSIFLDDHLINAIDFCFLCDLQDKNNGFAREFSLRCWYATNTAIRYITHIASRRRKGLMCAILATSLLADIVFACVALLLRENLSMWADLSHSHVEFPLFANVYRIAIINNSRCRRPLYTNEFPRERERERPSRTCIIAEWPYEKMRAEDHRGDLTRDSGAGLYTYIRACRREASISLCLCKTRAQKIFKPVSTIYTFAASSSLLASCW